MASISQLTIGLPTDGSTIMTAGYFRTLQSNINAWGSQFLPLVGGQLSGPVLWSLAQQFPAAQVVLPTNPPYPHTNSWRTVWDHINDASVHQIAGAPQAHASSHEIGGSDPLYGDHLAINAANPSESIKTYVDSAITTALGAVSLNYAPAATYEIGGTTPVFGNKIAINAANPNQDIKSYVDASIAALSSSIPANPTFTAVTAVSLAFSSDAALTANGKSVVSSAGGNTTVQATGTTGALQFGNASSATAYGTLNASGLSMGSTVVGPSSANINGPLTTAGDLSISRAAAGKPAVGALNFGQTNQQAYLSFNLDAANQFFVSTNTTIAGNLTLTAGGTLTVGTMVNVTSAGLNIVQVPVNITSPSGAGAVVVGADNNGSLALSTTLAGGQPFVSFTNPTATQQIKLSTDASTLTATGMLGALRLIANSGHTAAAGDLGLARSAGSGMVFFGTSAANSFDFGVTNNGSFTFIANNAQVAAIGTDGGFLVGSSKYGPLGAIVAGVISATKAIYAATGVTFGGVSGFAFSNSGNNYDTGLFSAGAGDLRLYSGGSTPALAILNGNATFNGATTVLGSFAATTLASSGAATIGGDLTVTGRLYAGNSTITKFRTKASFYLGYNSGTTSTGFTYPALVVPAYAGATVDAIRVSAVTADTTGAQTTIQILKNGQVIGSASLPNGQKTAKNLPIQANTPLSEGDVLQAVCTQAGTSTGVTVTLELSQYLT